MPIFSVALGISQKSYLVNVKQLGNWKMVLKISLCRLHNLPQNVRLKKAVSPKNYNSAESLSNA